MTRTSPPDWRLTWETDLGSEEHGAVADLLAHSYASDRFDRSWAGARPELRILGCRDGMPVAHAGVIRRFLRTPDRSQLVGDVGLVAVHPAHQGTGLGAALLAEVRRALEALELPYGFLTCDPHLRPFYARSGWVALADTDLRAIGIDHRVERDRRNAMVLPVRASTDAWPPGPVARDGQEI